jgi:hypothetical protein
MQIVAPDLDGFRWHRPSSGGYVLDGDALRHSHGFASDSYFPFEDEPALFRKLADLPLDDVDAVVGFANAYGPLTSGRFPVVDESIDLWRDQIFALRTALSLFDLVSSGGRSLQRIAQPRLSNNVFRVQVPFDTSKHWQIGMPPELAKDIRTAADRAMYVVASIVHSAIAKHSVALLPVWIKENNGFEMRAAPSSLLAAIWFQSAMHMSAAAPPLSRCEVCDQWMQPERRSRKYCSDACKMKAYRRGKA